MATARPSPTDPVITHRRLPRGLLPAQRRGTRRTGSPTCARSTAASRTFTLVERRDRREGRDAARSTAHVDPPGRLRRRRRTTSPSPCFPGDRRERTRAAELWKYLQHATSARSRHRTRLIVEAGLFPSPVGPEVIPIKDNWNWSRSNLFFGLPALSHGRARLARRSAAAGPAMRPRLQRLEQRRRQQPYPSVAVSARVREAATRLGPAPLLRRHRAPDGRTRGQGLAQPARCLRDDPAVTDQVSVLVHADAGVEPNDIGRSAWAAGAVYGKVQLTPRSTRPRAATTSTRGSRATTASPRS